tara:strand:- start:1082 stop:2248 length:1167 start_codon:yes stop_codon:yes gene_type:complete
MDIISIAIGAIDRLKKVNETFAKDSMKKKHANRKRFYSLLYGYINSSGDRKPIEFFDWYIDRLDEKMEIAPQWLSFWYKISKTKNEAGLRSFLNDCSQRSRTETNFFKVIEPWLPEDEFRILSSSTLSDLSKVLKMAITMCEDKDDIQKQVHSAIFSNIPIIGIGVFFHYFIFTFIYQAFITPGFQEHKSPEKYTMLEENFIRYQWVIDNYIYVGIGIIALIMFLSWSVKNWGKRGMFFREHYIDYIPPYSLSKINNQYTVLMLLSNFYKSGKSFTDSLEEIKKGASPYLQYQLNKILGNSAVQAHLSLKTRYLGSLGGDVSDRASNESLDTAIDSLLPSMKEENTERFNRIIKVTMMMSFKPLIYGSLAFSIVPVFIDIFNSLPKDM